MSASDDRTHWYCPANCGVVDCDDKAHYPLRIASDEPREAGGVIGDKARGHYPECPVLLKEGHRCTCLTYGPNLTSASDAPRCTGCGARSNEPHSTVCPEWKQEKFTHASDEPRVHTCGRSGPRNFFSGPCRACSDAPRVEWITLDDDSAHRAPLGTSVILAAVLAEVARQDASNFVPQPYESEEQKEIAIAAHHILLARWHRDRAQRLSKEGA